jgi:hypothetical protein
MDDIDDVDDDDDDDEQSGHSLQLRSLLQWVDTSLRDSLN